MLRAKLQRDPRIVRLNPEVFGVEAMNEGFWSTIGDLGRRPA
jgi:hypothetical protein